MLTQLASLHQTVSCTYELNPRTLCPLSFFPFPGSPVGNTFKLMKFVHEPRQHSLSGVENTCSGDQRETSQTNLGSSYPSCPRRFPKMTDNLGRILGIELLTAAQGLEFRKLLSTSLALCRQRNQDYYKKSDGDLLNKMR